MAELGRSISDKIIKSDFVKWREFEILQPAGFKELTKQAYQKLRNSIIENDFVESFKVWEHEDKIYCLDGVHRCKVLDILDGEGYDIPDKFRADFIECEDKKQAKKMVLVYSSRYAKLLEDGLYEFVQDLNWEELTQVIDLPDVDLDRFTDGYMRDTEGLTDEDEIPEVTDAITKTGDLWLLGEHRVLCGDATKKEDVDRLMDGQKADMVFTDPPYGIKYDNRERWDGIKKQSKSVQRMRGEMIIGDDKEFDPSFILQNFFYCKEIFLWGLQYYLERLSNGGVIVWNRKTRCHCKTLGRLHGKQGCIRWLRKQQTTKSYKGLSWLSIFYLTV